MATISMTRDIKITTDDAQKILNSQPSKQLQELLKTIEVKATTSSSNKLIAKYID